MKEKYVNHEKLQAFILYLERGMEAVEKRYPQHFQFVYQNMNKSYLEVKHMLLATTRPVDKAHNLYYDHMEVQLHSDPEKKHFAALNSAILGVKEIIKIFESQLPPLTANYWREVEAELLKMY